ncbi:MAG TPA: retropepsin-like aspartic protease [Longimicrobiales bacterium]|nr:retropepsin-like aspartic protease [Longimicrobiales bacterium]
MKRTLTTLMLLSAACTDLSPQRVEVAADSAAGEIAFELAGPGGAALVVPVRINGEGPYQFVLDTGATVTCLDDQVVSALDLPEVTGVIGTAAGIGGQGGVSLVSLDSLSIGGVRAFELEACVIDLEHLSGVGLELHGLIGLNVLSEFLVTLDFERNILTLENP